MRQKHRARHSTIFPRIYALARLSPLHHFAWPNRWQVSGAAVTITPPPQTPQQRRKSAPKPTVTQKWRIVYNRSWEYSERYCTGRQYIAQVIRFIARCDPAQQVAFCPKVVGKFARHYWRIGGCSQQGSCDQVPLFRASAFNYAAF